MPRIDDLGLSSKQQGVPDETLQPLYDSAFDPADFLNNTLSVTSFPSSQQANSKDGRLRQIQEASSEIQTLLSKLNAHNSRCSNSLTQLTDEILRSGSRLAYEVEILRGDVNSLYHALTDTLQEDIQKFAVTRPADLLQSTGDDGHTKFGADWLNANGTETQDPDFIT